VVSPQTPARANAYLAVFIAILVWGVAPALARDFSKTFGPWDAMFIRLVSVALMCAAFLPFSGVHIARKDWPRLLLVSMVGMTGYFLGSIYGFGALKAGVSGLIIAVQPLIITLMAAALGTQKLSTTVLAGLIISFLGAIYLFSGDLSLAGEPGQFWFGFFMLLLADVSFAINVVFSPPLVREYGALKTTLLTMILAAVPALFFFRPETPGIIANLGGYAWFSLFFLGFIGTIVVVVMWNYAVGILPPATMGASLYAIPPLAALAGYFILNETLTSQVLIAGAIILAGVALSEFGPRFFPDTKEIPK
jgi:drug/metabolite transporter (DMT)-like permease